MPSGKCPHCHRDTIFKHRSHLEPETPFVNTSFGTHPRRGMFWLATCDHKDCKGVVFREVNPSNDEETWDMYPPVELAVEEELKDPIRRSYQEALKVFSGGHWTAAVQALGRTLHDATAELRPASFSEADWLKKRSYPRIEELGKSGIIPESMKQWLHEIRDSRIWATHGDEYHGWWADELEAREALEFTKWFLRYAFILPEQLRKRKARLQAAGQKKPATPPAPGSSAPQL